MTNRCGLLPPQTNEVCEGYGFTPVCHSVGGGGGGACVHGRGHVWQGVCEAGRHAWQGVSVAGGMHGRGVCVAGRHACQGVCVAEGHAWQGGVRGWGACMAGGHACHTCPPTLWDTVSQCVGGMHPTGMHSYLHVRQFWVCRGVNGIFQAN